MKIEFRDIEFRVLPASNHSRCRVAPSGCLQDGSYRVYRGLAFILMSAYLTISGWYFYRHVLGDQQACPLQYAFTWDMFPNYPMWSSRRYGVVKTRSSGYYLIFPDRRRQLRRGHSESHTRIDLPRDDVRLKAAISQAVNDFAATHPDDLPVWVFAVERYWPVVENRHTHQFPRWPRVATGTGGSETKEPGVGTIPPDRPYTRIIDEGPATSAGTAHHAELPRWRVQWGQP